jgi:hypothetical protein
MKSAAIRSFLKENKALLRKRFKVKRIGLFGSRARGDERSGSAIDLLVEFSGPVGWDFLDLKEFLEEGLGRKVDLVTYKALKPAMKAKVLREVVYP